jgi:hypothetical protein
VAEIDEILWQDTKENLMAAAAGQEEIEWLVEEQLQDMKECGFFDIPEEFRIRDEDERDDYY